MQPRSTFGAGVPPVLSDTEAALGELDKITRRIATLQVEKQVLRDHEEDDPESQLRLEEIYSEMTSLYSALVRARQSLAQ